MIEEIRVLKENLDSLNEEQTSAEKNIEELKKLKKA